MALICPMVETARRSGHPYLCPVHRPDVRRICTGGKFSRCMLMSVCTRADDHRRDTAASSSRSISPVDHYIHQTQEKKKTTRKYRLESETISLKQERQSCSPFPLPFHKTPCFFHPFSPHLIPSQNDRPSHGPTRTTESTEFTMDHVVRQSPTSRSRQRMERQSL